jgi:hypothetical protein
MALPKKSSYLMGGTYNSAPFILADGDLSPFQLDVNGNLRVTVTGGSSSNPAAGSTGSPVPASASYTGVNIGGTLFGITGLNLTNAVPATVAIVDGNGNQITSFGGGTQFADNSASGATPTGTLSMGWDSANSKVRALKVDTSQNLLVDVSNTTLAVTQSTSPWVISFTAPQHIIVDSGSVSISGTVSVTQGTSPWIVAGAITPADSFANPTDAQDVFALNAGWDVTNGKWQRLQVNAGTGTLKVDPGTVTVIGTVTANQGTTPWTIQGDSASGAAKAGNPVQVGGVFNTTQPTVTSGQTVEAQSTARGALIVATGVDTFTVSVSGNVGVTQQTSPWVDNVTQIAGVALGATAVVNYGSTPAAVPVPGVNAFITNAGSIGGGTQYPDAAASGAHPIGTQLIGWNKGGLTELAVTALSLANAQAIEVAIVDGSGNQITSFGGGTQYADNAASGVTPTGTLSMGWDSVNSVVRALKVDTNQNLLVAGRGTAGVPGTALLVSDPQTVSLVDLMQTLLLETRAMRSAIVYMITENGDVMDTDFDPSNQDFQPAN